MKLFPAIDIRNGCCVRLRQGVFEDSQIYSNDPLCVAQEWEAQGASCLHLVDLDGAQAGHGVNREIVQKIVETIHIPVQLGGGIRTIMDVDSLLNMGVGRVIIGTKALTNPGFIKECLNLFGDDKIVIGVDAKDGMVAVSGWEKVSQVTAYHMGMMMREYGVRYIVYTDISRDGMLQGPNIEMTRSLSETTGLNVIASGGVSCMNDLVQIRDAGIYGAIIGKALYEKRIILKDAVAMFEQDEK